MTRSGVEARAEHPSPRSAPSPLDQLPGCSTGSSQADPWPPGVGGLSAPTPCLCNPFSNIKRSLQNANQILPPLGSRPPGSVQPTWGTVCTPAGSSLACPALLHGLLPPPLPHPEADPPTFTLFLPPTQRVAALESGLPSFPLPGQSFLALRIESRHLREVLPDRPIQTRPSVTCCLIVLLFVYLCIARFPPH